MKGGATGYFILEGFGYPTGVSVSSAGSSSWSMISSGTSGTSRMYYGNIYPKTDTISFHSGVTSISVPTITLSPSRNTYFEGDVEFKGNVKFRDPPSQLIWQEIEVLPNGARVGKMGALRYLLAPGSKNLPISPGYHTISPNGNGYTATLGSKTYKLDLDGHPIVETITIEKPVIKTIYKTEVIPMQWTTWNVLVVAVIALVVVKLLAPRITLRNVVKVSVKVIAWPIRRLLKQTSNEVKAAVNEAAAEERADKR